MSDVENNNKQILQTIFEATARGDGRPYRDALADDVTFTVVASNAWARTYAGKASVLKDLLIPVGGNFTGPNQVSAHNFLADGDTVVVEGRNHSVTKAGPAYPQQYCWIIRMRDGKMVEVKEYADTALVDRVLTPPVG